MKSYVANSCRNFKKVSNSSKFCNQHFFDGPDNGILGEEFEKPASNLSQQLRDLSMDIQTFKPHYAIMHDLLKFCFQGSFTDLSKLKYFLA